MLYYIDKNIYGQKVKKQIKKIHHFTFTEQDGTREPVLRAITRVDDYAIDEWSAESFVRNLWKLATSIPGVGYWANNLPWNNADPYKNTSD